MAEQLLRLEDLSPGHDGVYARRIAASIKSVSISVAFGMGLMPPPRAGDDGLQIGELGAPVQLPPNPRRAGDQDRRIARTSGRLDHGDRTPGDIARDFDHLAH